MSPQARLVVGDRDWSLTPDRVYILGRAVDADVCLDHPEVSRRHATLSFASGRGWVIRDAGSLNGIRIDGRKVAETPLANGRPVLIGTSPDAPSITLVDPADDGEATRMGPVDGTPTGRRSVAVPAAAPATGEIVTIGRDPANTITVDDLLVSRRHVRATPRHGGYWVEDLDSLNGTFLDGAPVRAAMLTPGHRITVGHHEFHLIDGRLVMVEPDTRVTFRAEGLGYRLPSGKVLMSDVGFELPESSLMAVIGPSGAGKSTLLGALTAGRPATSGTVTVDGRDLYANYAELRDRIGVVPQDDVVHTRLTVRQALEYASLLRFPSDLDTAARRARVDAVIDDLDLRPHVGTRIDRLSGGQRKRTSVAMELLTEPSLLFLDEPTSGLDPSLDKSVMTTLRTLADDGRTVVVVTHSVANLGMCDRVLLLAPGGRVAFFGAPQDVRDWFGMDDYADIFSAVTTDPDRWVERFADRVSAPASAAPPPAPAVEAAAPRRRQSRVRQTTTLIRRHLTVLAADRSYALFTALLPLVLASLVAAVPGDAGFVMPQDPVVAEAEQLLVVLIVGAAFMGMASSCRDLVGERPILRRERAVGLSPGAYLVAKLVVFGLLALVQSALLTGLVLLVKAPPERGVLGGPGWVELYVAVVMTAFASACLGMVISATVSTTEQVMPLLVVAIMAQLVLCGGLIPVVGRAFLDQLSWIAPSRWGYAAGASTVDLLSQPTADHDDLWRHLPEVWAGSIAALLVIAAVGAALTAWRLRRVGR